MKHDISDDIRYSLAFALCKGIGPKTFNKLLSVFKTPKQAYYASSQKMKKIIGPSKTARFVSNKKSDIADSAYNSLINKNIQLIIPRSSEWKNKFAYIHDKPVVLFAKGDISLLRKQDTITLSIIGSRVPSSYGKSITEQFVQELCKHNIIIMSGLALGIDSLAHKTCLQSGGKTIAILGSGIDVVYPSKHARLYDDIIQSGGLILSEFPPGSPPLQGNFIQRNRLISGLSDGLIVIEGSHRSGTLITGRYANEQGKNVFAVPGPITSSLSYTPHALIQDGAALVTKLDDILAHYDISNTSYISQSELSDNESSLINAMCEEAQTTQALLNSVKIPLPEILSVLSSLEIKGLIRKNADGTYYVQQKINSNPTPSIPP